MVIILDISSIFAEHADGFFFPWESAVIFPLLENDNDAILRADSRSQKTHFTETHNTFMLTAHWPANSRLLGRHTISYKEFKARLMQKLSYQDKILSHNPSVHEQDLSPKWKACYVQNFRVPLLPKNSGGKLCLLFQMIPLKTWVCLLAA